MTFQKRNLSRNPESWRTPSSTGKSLKSPALKSAFPFTESAYTMRRTHPSLIYQTLLNFLLDLSFDRSCLDLLGGFPEPVRSQWRGHIFIRLLWCESCQQKNNGQRKNSDCPVEKLEASEASGQEKEGKLNDKINQKYHH